MKRTVSIVSDAAGLWHWVRPGGRQGTCYAACHTPIYTREWQGVRPRSTPDKVTCPQCASKLQEFLACGRPTERA